MRSKKMNLDRVGNSLCELAIKTAPLASGFCRGLFYEEKEPESLQELMSQNHKEAVTDVSK